ncbi:PqqD family protein [Metabacillus sp. GX 13764]|uniref:PqqD family protein n=1 Tax=Metabacillus kandeliae TaxID=2900151 RepID=UPI001E2BC37B|nr:PqqD family protein [Metabacillus kandeliae]MCD7036038.1 PqqD family protein [Metabacillus kandeliae]
MSRTELIPYFPEGVAVKGKFIHDEKISAKLPVNQTAKAILEEVDGKKNIDEIIEAVTKKFKVDKDRIFQDTAALFAGLNEKHFLNWKYASNSKVKEGLANFFAQYKRGYHERFPSEGSSFPAIFLLMLSAVTKKIAIFWLFVMILSAAGYIIAPTPFILWLAYYITVVYAGLMASFAVHEAMHASMHRKMAGSLGSGYLAADLMSIKFVRPAAAQYELKYIWITLLGPIVPAVIGIVGYTLSMTLMEGGTLGSTCQALSLTFLIHILYLLPFIGDGKSAVKQLLFRKAA